MEWKKNILQHLLQYPAGTEVPKRDIKAVVLPLAYAEGIERQRALAAFTDAVAGLRKREAIVNGGRYLAIPDKARAEACLKRAGTRESMKGRCPEDGCERNIRSFGYCAPCAERLHAAGVLTLDGHGNPLPVCSREDCGKLRHKQGLCTGHLRETEGVKSRMRVDAVPREHYDWVVVNRYWHGRRERALSHAEKVEFVRLALRSIERLNGSAHAITERVGMKNTDLHVWIARYGDEARGLGLDLPLRFCFLEDEDEKGDVRQHERTPDVSGGVQTDRRDPTVAPVAPAPGGQEVAPAGRSVRRDPPAHIPRTVTGRDRRFVEDVFALPNGWKRKGETVKRDANGTPVLTLREQVILRRIANGQTSQDISKSLRVAVSAVRYQIAHARKRFEAETNEELVAVLNERGLLD